MLIVYLLKKSPYGSAILVKLISVKTRLIRLLVLFALLAVTSSYANGNNPNNKIIAYKVVKNNKNIGTIRVIKINKDNAITYKLESDIEAKYLLRFHIVGSEQSIYKNGALVYSSVYRKVNDKVKVNHTVTLKNGQYTVKTKNKERSLELETIHNNLVTLYFNEPKRVKSIYCDNIKKNALIEVLENGKYKVEFSRSKYNIFHYKSGKCIKIEAFSSLFDVTLIPMDS
jgi:Cu/Zn superoxide dismutase